jgi:hypothetical protein
MRTPESGNSRNESNNRTTNTVATPGKAGMLAKVLYMYCSVASNIQQGPQQQQQDLTTRKLGIVSRTSNSRD